MSAPKTDLDKQAKRHRGPIYGITIGLIAVALLALAAFLWPGVPLDEQAAPDGEPTETTTGDPVTAPDLENGAAPDAPGTQSAPANEEESGAASQ